MLRAALQLCMAAFGAQPMSIALTIRGIPYGRLR
jgi:hypothetical protein